MRTKLLLDKDLLRKDRDTTFYLRGPWANWMTREASQNLEGSLGILPWKSLSPRSSNWLEAMLIFVPQYRLTLQEDLCWDVHIPKNQESLIHLYQKAIVELKGTLLWL